MTSVVVQDLCRPYHARDKGIHPFKSLDNPTPPLCDTRSDCDRSYFRDAEIFFLKSFRRRMSCQTSDDSEVGTRKPSQAAKVEQPPRGELQPGPPGQHGRRTSAGFLIFRSALSVQGAPKKREAVAVGYKEQDFAEMSEVR
jgi:hypothetical protein